MTYEFDVEDVEYVRHGNTPLLARLFKPRGEGPFPLIVELHGGAWCRGDRLNDNVMNEALAKTGVVVASLDFRMPPVAPYPGSMADINYGIRWAKTRAAQWHSRADMVRTMGSSSGGHQAMLSAMRPEDARHSPVAAAQGSAVGESAVSCAVLGG